MKGVAEAFDVPLAVTLLDHAQAVYRSADDFEAWALAGSDGAHILSFRSTQVGITYSATRIVIAARGSSQFGDWGENILALRVPWRRYFPEGLVHLGFVLQARRVATKLVRLLRAVRAKYPGAPIYIAGHSLGGALALLLRRILDVEGIPVRATYTFEGPRVGNTAFAAWFDRWYGRDTFRVVAIRRGCVDIVTRLPLSVLGWSHVGRPIMICDGRLFESAELWEIARASHPVEPVAWWRVFTRFATSIGAHLCAPLLAELRALRG